MCVSVILTLVLVEVCVGGWVCVCARVCGCVGGGEGAGGGGVIFPAEKKGKKGITHDNRDSYH